MKRLILIILCAAMFCVIYSCSSDGGNADNAETSLENILKDWRTDGMTSWWEILAVYNADENPLDYKGFDEILSLLESATTTLERASYVIVTNTVVAIGADPDYFEEYENYKRMLKAVVENPGGGNLNEYIFAYLALKTSGDEFNETPVRDYLEAAQKSDGGFALSGDTGDVDITAFMIPAIILLYYDNLDLKLNVFAIWEPDSLSKASKFLQDNINGDGTFSSWGNANANSTAVALSALMANNSVYMSGDGEFLRIVREGLSLFEKSGGYAVMQDMERDITATAQGALALGDYKNSTNVWIKLYLEILE